MPKGTDTHNRHVIWARCKDAAQLSQVAALEDVLRKDGDNVRFICTLPRPGQLDAIVAPNTQREVRQFIHTHRPIAAVWLGGALEYAALAPCHAVDLPIIVLEGQRAMLNALNTGWRPNRTRASLARLHSIFVNDADAKSAFTDAGVSPSIIQVAGSLDDTSSVLPYRESDRVELAEALGTRPVWLASAAHVDDIPMLCTAHREAARRAHRLLLIIAPYTLANGPEIAEKTRQLGWNTAVRSDGDEPEEATQIYVVDEDEGLGLWYRIAPITLLGGTFGDGALDDPFHPAALGSVTIHGPMQGIYKRRFSQLIKVDATFPIARPNAVGEAVAALLSVDQAAEKANAGWDVTSRGAGALAMIGATLQDIIDGNGH